MTAVKQHPSARRTALSFGLMTALGVGAGAAVALSTGPGAGSELIPASATKATAAATPQPEITDSRARWIPAEHRSGRGRWRDAGVYVDGKPVGMLWFGELPRDLAPVWVDEVEGLDFRPGDPPPYERIVRVRRYRVADYLEAVGVAMADIGQIHFYGPNGQILGVSGAEFRAVADRFYFRFGLATHGKPIAVVPSELGANFDRLLGICVYIRRPPPRLTRDGAFLAGRRVRDVPYYGEPLRGGIRVYLDDRLVAVLKRHQLLPSLSIAGAGALRWNVFELLRRQRVDTSGIVALEVIHDERRGELFSGASLAAMTFESSPQARGEILLDGATRAHALAYYTHPLSARQERP